MDFLEQTLFTDQLSLRMLPSVLLGGHMRERNGGALQLRSNREYRMVKSALIEKMSEEYPGLSEDDIIRIVDLFFGEIAHHLQKGGRVELRSFGVFSVRLRQARDGRNPRTGVKVPVTAKHILHFKPGKLMRDRLQIKALID